MLFFPTYSPDLNASMCSHLSAQIGIKNKGLEKKAQFYKTLEVEEIIHVHIWDRCSLIEVISS